MSSPSSFAARALDLSLVVAGDAAASDGDRALAASVARVVLAHRAWDERTAADVLEAIRRALNAPAVVRQLVDALVRASLDEHRVGTALGRLAEEAFRLHRAGALHALVTAMLLDDRWCGLVAPSWMPVAVNWALGRVWRPICAAASLLEAWVVRYGADEPWIRGTVDRCPLIMRSKQLPLSVRRALLGAAPTIHGWRFLSHETGSQHFPPWTPTYFGDRADVAVESLQCALGEEGANGARVLLARWLVELVGDASMASQA